MPDHFHSVLVLYVRATFATVFIQRGYRKISKYHFVFKFDCEPYSQGEQGKIATIHLDFPCEDSSMLRLWNKCFDSRCVFRALTSI